MRDDGSIKVSRALKTLNIQIEKYIQSFRQSGKSEPTIAELSKHFLVDEQEIVYAMDSRKSLLSLDDKQDETNPHSRTIMESIEDTDRTENMIDKIVLNDLLKELPSKDKKLIALRYFEDKTQSEIADILNVSQVQVSRLENKIISKLKSKFKQ